MSDQYGISKIPPSQCGFYKPTADVIELPCKVGQTLYALWMGGRKGKGIAEFQVRSINLDTPEDMEIVYRSKKQNATMCRYANASDIGKTLFLTREEAEKALERSENGK
jgi:hypothetical protein